MPRALLGFLILAFTGGLPGRAQSATVEVIDCFDPIPEEVPPPNLQDSSPLPRNGVFPGSEGSPVSSGAAPNAGIPVWRFEAVLQPWYDAQDYRQFIHGITYDNWSERELSGKVTLQGTAQSKVEANIGIQGVLSANLAFEQTRTISFEAEYKVPPRRTGHLRLEAVMYTCLFKERCYILGVPTYAELAKAYMAMGHHYSFATQDLPGDPKGQ